MTDQRNLLLTVVLTALILIGWQYLFPPPEPPVEPTEIVSEDNVPTPQVDGVPAAPGAAPALPGNAAEREAVVANDDRIRINSDRLHGTLRLAGARIDDLTLADYRETTDPTSPEVTLLSPSGTRSPYFAEFGWTVAPGATHAVPGPDTAWTANGTDLTPETPITLTWDNGAGLRFERTISLDEHYMFTVRQTVTNTTADTVTLYPYGLVRRVGTPDTLGFFILHEGLLGVLDGALVEYDYDDIIDDGTVDQVSTGGWVGITDKYWLAALVPDQATRFTGRFSHTAPTRIDRYQVDYLGDPVVIAPGAAGTTENSLFAGAKEVHLLDAYAEELGIANFDLAIDFGWFYWITKPLFLLIDWFNGILGNFGLAILAATVVIKLIFYPLADKSYKSMSRMRKLQPQMMELREKFGDDKQRMSQELMELYKREKVNPLAGCWPILIQIPVFFALYKVLFVTIEMRHAPFYGWIDDLSAQDPTTIFNAFGLLPFDNLPGFLMVGAWPVLMGITMYLQQKLNPQPPDPMQAKILMFLPLIFVFVLAPFPAGLVIYWTWNNLLSILQQWTIMKRDKSI